MGKVQIKSFLKIGISRERKYEEPEKLVDVRMTFIQGEIIGTAGTSVAEWRTRKDKRSVLGIAMPRVANWLESRSQRS